MLLVAACRLPTTAACNLKGSLLQTEHSHEKDKYYKEQRRKLNSEIFVVKPICL
jgi:hypothetical protein